MSTTIREVDLGRGIDQLHPESKLAPGYALDILNGIARSTGSLVKRKGYRRFGGYVPLRVVEYAQDPGVGGAIILTVDDCYDVSTIPIQNIIIRGRTTATNGDFPVTAFTSRAYTVQSATTTTITVASQTSATVTGTTDVDLVIYGLDMSLYGAADAAERFSWTTLLSQYITQDDETPITSVAGVPYRSSTAAEINEINSGLAPQDLEGQFSFWFSAAPGPGDNKYRGVAFYDYEPTNIPNRGVIITSVAGMNRCPVVSATYNGGVDQTTTYRLYAPAHTFAGGNPIAANDVSDVLRAETDYLTVEEVSWAALRGEFRIKLASSVIVGDDLVANYIDVEVYNDANAELDSQKSDANLYGFAGVYTDTLPPANPYLYPPGCILRSDNTDIDEMAMRPYATQAAVVACGPWSVEPTNIFNARIAAEMTGQVINVSTAAVGTPIMKVVRGDEIFCSADGRTRRVVNTNPNTTSLWESTGGDGEELTLTSSSTPNPGLRMIAGDRYFFYGVEGLVGEFEVTEVVSATEIKIATDYTDVTAPSAIAMLSNTITLDEPVTFVNTGPSDESTFSVTRRWTPLPNFYDPNSQFQPALPMPSHQFDAAEPDEQDYIASAAVSKSLYMTNNSDPVKKYDGYEVYNAGIPAVPSLLFITRNRVDNGIYNPNRTVAYTAQPGAFELTVAAGDEAAFAVGDRICVYSSGEEVFTNVASTASGSIRTTTSVDAVDATGSIIKSITLKYYAKFRMIDNQGNPTYSAGMRSQDFTVEFGPTTEIQGCLAAFPPISNFPYSRMEYEIYRTSGTAGAPPYYLVTGSTYTFTSYTPYIYFSDTVQLDQLSDFTGTELGSPDPNSALRGGVDTGPQFDRPPLAKYAASLDARLALGNIKSPHKMEIVFRRPPSRPIAGSLHLAPSFTFTRGTTPPVDNSTNDVDQYTYRINSWTGSGAFPITSLVQWDDYFDVTATFLTPVVGSWVYLFTSGALGTDPTVGVEHAGWWQVNSSPAANTVRILRAGVAEALTVGAATTLLIPTGGATAVARFRTGQPVYLTGAADSGSLVRNTTFFVRVFNNTTLKVYATQANAFTDTSPLASVGAATFDIHVGDINLRPTQLQNAFTGTIPLVLPESTGPTSVRDLNYDVVGGNPTVAVQSLENFIARRLADSINASMAATDRTVTGFEEFTPFLYARAGNDVGYGKVVVEALDPNQPFTFTYTPELGAGEFDVYVNGEKYDRSAATSFSTVTGTVTSEQKTYPSRVVLSYSNYPEIFDGPYALDAASSDSVVDVSPDDGQEITGIIPFFGTSFSTAAQQNQKLVVMKERSVYIVDVRTKQVDFVESHGQGLTWPRTLSDTNQGIMFANDSGIYCLRRDNRVQYIGQMVERLWKERLSTTADKDIPSAYNDVYDQLWMVSLPIVDTDDEAVNSETLTYDYTREESGETGSWQRYDGIPGEASVQSTYLFDTLVGSYGGAIYVERNDDVPTDYRDDLEAINFRARMRPMVFDAPGMRKKLTSFDIAFRTITTAVGTAVRTSIDYLNQYIDCDAFELNRPGETTGFDVATTAIEDIGFSAPMSKFDSISVEIQNEALDEGVEIADLVYNIEPLNEHGIKQAKETVTR